MGHRASYVIVRGGEPRIFASRFGAQTVGRDLFAGPEEAIALVESLTPDDQLYTHVWCEGGAFVDEDARTLLFFGDDYHCALSTCLPLRRAFLAVLAERWPGWDVRWAHQGVVDFELRLGMAPGRGFDPPRPPEEYEVRWARESFGADEDGFPYRRTAGTPPPEDPWEDRQTFVTVVGEGGAARDVISRRDPRELLIVGPRLLEWIDAAPPAPYTTELHVQGGVLIDLPRRTVESWRAEALSDHALSRFAASWPGWRLTRQTEGLVAQLERSGRDGSAARISDEQVAGWVRAMLEDRSGYDLDAALAQRVAALAARPGVTAVAADPRPHASTAPGPGGERPRGWLARLLGRLGG